VIIWRISNYADLSGQGGLRAAARWHHACRPIVYAASSPASVLLEVLVHLELGEPAHLPNSYKLLQIDVPDNLAVTEVDEASLQSDWRERTMVTRIVGDVWLRELRTALLAVPSAIVPHTKNYLINPAHPDIQRVRISSFGSYPFDFRLFK
jgi:RES domain-containing protein